ncbi:hypothetical protein F5B17DRAFT_451779 [Nemania serpens]|nr:hypothetical protein F5B17DRAFT_451779 [Nemania serpens]
MAPFTHQRLAASNHWQPETSGPRIRETALPPERQLRQVIVGADFVCLHTDAGAEDGIQRLEVSHQPKNFAVVDVGPTNLYETLDKIFYRESPCLVCHYALGLCDERLRSGSRPGNVAIALADGTAYIYDGTGDSSSTSTLESGENWVIARLCQGWKSGKMRVFYTKATSIR